MQRHPPNGWDSIDQVLSRELSRERRAVELRRPLPQPTADEPSDELLLQLVEGSLEGQAKRDAEAAIAAHPYSSARLEILRDALGDFERTRLSPDEGHDASSSPWARLVLCLGAGAERALRFLRGSDLPLSLDIAAHPLRGGNGHSAGTTTSHYLRFERRFGDWDAQIDLEAASEQQVSMRLTLSRDGTPMSSGRATLYRTQVGSAGQPDESRVIESVRVREGVAGFSGLTPAHYEVAITLAAPSNSAATNGTPASNEEVGRLDLQLLEQ